MYDYTDDLNEILDRFWAEPTVWRWEVLLGMYRMMRRHGTVQVIKELELYV
jgi:hypothetical protein